MMLRIFMAGSLPSWATPGGGWLFWRPSPTPPRCVAAPPHSRISVVDRAVSKGGSITAKVRVLVSDIGKFPRCSVPDHFGAAGHAVDHHFERCGAHSLSKRARRDAALPQ